MTVRDHQNKLIEDEIEVPKGYMDTKVFIQKNTIMGLLTVRDLLYASVLGIMGGFISSLVPFSLIMKTIYPLTGGSQLLSGHHLLWMTIAYGTTQKKSSLIITPLLKGIIEFLLGDNWGALIILINLFEGCCLICAFLFIEKVGEYKTNFGWALAGGLGNLPQAPLFWAMNKRFALEIHWSLAFVTFIFAFLSGCLISGFLGRVITISIKKSMGEIT